MTSLYRRNGALPQGLTEVGRTMRSKTFNLGDRKRKLVQTIGALHWWDGEDWADIDLQPVLQADGMWRVDQAPYKLIVDPVTAWLRHESRANGARARVGLNTVGGQPVTLPVPTIEDGRFLWENVVEGLDLELVLKPKGAEWFKIVRSADAPHTLAWGVERQEGFQGNIKLVPEGVDAAGDPLRMVTQEGAHRTVDGWEKFEIAETFARQVSRIVDPQTRRREWKDDVAYPVRIDADIEEGIAADGDDGFEQGSTWVAAHVSGNIFVGQYFYAYNGGWRFTEVAINQGVTIDQALLRLYKTSTTGSPTATIRGDDADSAAAWGSSSRPSQITQTTASASASLGGSNNTYQDQNVTAIVQEIVDREGWSSGNDMRFAALETTGFGNFWTIHDYSQTGTNHGLLEIDYTEGGGASTYDESVGFDILAGDGPSAALTTAGALHEGLSAGDTAAAMLGIGAALTIGIAAGDGSTASLTIPGVVAEGIAAGDGSAASLVVPGAITGGVAAGSAIAGGLRLGGAISEAVAFADGIGVSVTLDLLMAESAVAGDGSAATLAAAAALAEGADLGDVRAALLSLATRVGEGIRAGDLASIAPDVEPEVIRLTGAVRRSAALAGAALRALPSTGGVRRGLNLTGKR